jgi:hypothetical protein
VNYDGSTLGALKFTGDTAQQFRRDVMLPFFDQYLKDGAPGRHAAGADLPDRRQTAGAAGAVAAGRAETKNRCT